MTGKAVAMVRQEPGTEVAVIGSAPVAAEMSFSDTLQLGKVLAASGYFKDISGEAQAVTKILYGREVGVGPVTALMSVHVIEGKPAPSANLIAARIRASGRYDYRVREHSGEACRVEFFIRAGAGWESLGLVEWTLADARNAGVAGKAVWKQYPRAMLFARVISEGARVHCPEIFGGAPVYVPEELGAEVDQDGAPILPAYVPEPDAVSDEQVALIDTLRRSHTVTEDEQEGLDKRLERGMTRAQAKAAIDWLKATIKEREAAEQDQTPVAEREPGSDDGDASTDPDDLFDQAQAKVTARGRSKAGA